MRMRLKTNLYSRIDKNDARLIKIDTSERNVTIATANKTYVSFSEIFGNENPIYLDLGCGKGQFSIEFATRHPEINVIGIEMISNVIVSALESSADLDLPNLRFMSTGADYLPKYFKDKTISRIYLNFSTPKQKNSYANSRLTSPRFLTIYDKLLVDKAEIHQKTDDMDFFEYSLESYKDYGFTLKDLSNDLTSLNLPENIVTEYEARFVAENKPINKVVAFLDK